MKIIKKQILKALEKPKSVWQLFKEVDSHAKEIVRCVQDLLKEGLVNVKKGRYYLTHKGNKFRKKERLHIKINWNNLLKKTKQICKSRPKVDDRLDQGYQRFEDIIKRVKLIYERCELQNSKILVLGDDGSQSISLALTKLPKKINCLEIDERIVSFINKVSKKENLKLRATKYDVRDPLKIKKEYDVFITDPIETDLGLKLFLFRGASKLKRGGVMYFTLAKTDFSKERFYKLQRMLNKAGFVITDIIRNFSMYPENQLSKREQEEYYRKSKLAKILKGDFILPDIDYYTSNLIRVEIMGHLKIPVRNIRIDGEIYQDRDEII